MYSLLSLEAYTAHIVFKKIRLYFPLLMLPLILFFSYLVYAFFSFFVFAHILGHLETL